MRNTLLGCCLLMSAIAFAHHGLATFDVTTKVTIKGEVTDFHFVNPHCVVEFDVKDDKGQVQQWQVELGNPDRLTKKGWNAASLEAGDEVSVTGYRAKNGAKLLWATKIVSPKNGKELILEGR